MSGGVLEERGQSEIIGFALIIALTLLATTTVVVFGTTALDDTEQQAEIDRASNAMTQLDSRAAEVALSDTATQSVRFGQIDGDYSVEESAGRISVVHVNCGSTTDGNIVDDGNNDGDEEIYSSELGAVIYRNGDSTVAYQGGGVWRVGQSGQPRLVSPPEFHYRSGTLTLPAIRTKGSGGGGGSVTANIRRTANPFDRTYPVPSQSYSDNDCSRNYDNPLNEGFVVIRVESRYAAGWAEYFRDRTGGTVNYLDGGTPNDLSDDSVTLELRTLGPQGSFPMPSDQDNAGGSVPVRGLDTDGHNLDEFKYTIWADDQTNSKFNNLQWSMWAKSGNKRLELSFPSGEVSCGDTATLYIYYTPDNHASSHTWTVPFTVDCGDQDGDGSSDVTLTVDLTGSKTATYQDQVLGPSQLQKFGTDANNANSVSSLVFDQHQSASMDPDQGSSLTYTDGSTEDASHVIRHYFAEMGPSFELKVNDQQTGQAGVAENPSGGTILYSGGGSVVTFMHISENRIEIDLN